METSHKHHHTAETNLHFNMAFHRDTEVIKAGGPVKLFFKPEVANQPDYVVPLTLLHEKKIHLLIMSKDLSYFSHEHPEPSENGEYVCEHTFPSGGQYVLFQDYMPEEAAQQLVRQEIQVAGDQMAKASTNTVATTWKEDGYEVNIFPNGSAFKVNAAVMLNALVTKNGLPVTDLEKYLGSLAHVVIISSDTQDYLHVHPMGSVTKGPEIMIHTHFPKSGYYSLFMEFKHEGRVRLASFKLAAESKK